MSRPAQLPAPAVIIDVVIETLVSEGADLRDVTLDEFKQRLTQAIYLLRVISKTTAA